MKKTMEELVNLARDGDQEAISQLYEQTYNSVYQSVLAIVRDEDEAMDIVQDSYIKGFQNLHKLDDPEKYQAWMKRLASNMALDCLRKKRPALFSERVDEEGQEIDLRHEDDCLEHMPEEVIDRQETARLMNEILGKLSQEQRLAVVLFYYEERSVREIAEMLDCSENTVKSRLNYGRKKIEAEVLALEKRGTKLYSLAPLPFFLWVVRMAKGYGIALETAASTAAVGAAGAAAAGETAAAGGTAAGGTAAAAAGNSASATAAAGTAAKAAGTAAGKTVATKIVAGTLAATMTVGAGVAVVSGMGGNKENKAAHGVYEEFLDRYQYAFEQEYDVFLADHDRFWEEISQDILRRNPNLDLTKTNDWYLDYVPGEGFSGDIPLPDTVYDPNMDEMKLFSTNMESQDIRYAYHDLDDDGVDEMIVATFYEEIFSHVDSIDVYAVRDGQMYRGEAEWEFHDGIFLWTVQGTSIVEYADPGVVYISLGKEYFDGSMTLEEPELQWQILYSVVQEETFREETSVREETQETEPAATEDPYEAVIESLAGNYRYSISLGKVVWGDSGGGVAYHELRITVTDEEIIIEDLGEPQQSVENRNTFLQKMEEQGKTLKPEQYEYMVFENLGTMRIDRSSITFDSDSPETRRYAPVTIRFDDACFEGPTAPNGYVNAMEITPAKPNATDSIDLRNFGGSVGLHISHGPNHFTTAGIYSMPLTNNDLHPLGDY